MPTPIKQVQKICENCKYIIQHQQSPTQYFCLRLSQAPIPIKPNDFCSYFTTETYTCGCCGHELPGHAQTIVVTDETATEICEQCNANSGKCITCINSQKCDFETNPSTLPKIIQKTIQQGNMTSVTQVRNPERIRITCQNGCPCWSEDFDCYKQNHGTCPQYRMNRV